MFEKYDKMFIFDTETSALSPEPHGEILEFGGILLSKPKGSNKFSDREDISILIKNKYPILNSHIHHITETMCDEEGIEKIDFFNILKRIFGDYEKTLIVAYNTPFDMKFVKHFMSKMSKGYKIKNPTLDILEIARDRTKTRKGNKLCDMIIRYDVKDVQNSHRALDDCNALLGVMRAMWKEKADLEDYIK